VCQVETLIYLFLFIYFARSAKLKHDASNKGCCLEPLEFGFLKKIIENATQSIFKESEI